MHTLPGNLVHTLGCLSAFADTGRCTCEEIRADAERKREEYARKTPYPPINGMRFKV